VGDQVLPRDAAREAAVIGRRSLLAAANRRFHAAGFEGTTIDEVCQAVNRARSTATEYLADAIALHGISDHSPWVSDATFDRIVAAAKQHADGRLKPIKEALGDDVGYDEIRIVLACLRNAAPEA